MALARELGLNAITLTGGAGAKPNKYTLAALKDKHVIICYDNDKAGRVGMSALNDILVDVCSDVEYIDISEGAKGGKRTFMTTLRNMVTRFGIFFRYLPIVILGNLWKIRQGNFLIYFLRM